MSIWLGQAFPTWWAVAGFHLCSRPVRDPGGCGRRWGYWEGETGGRKGQELVGWWSGTSEAELGGSSLTPRLSRQLVCSIHGWNREFSIWKLPRRTNVNWYDEGKGEFLFCSLSTTINLDSIPFLMKTLHKYVCCNCAHPSIRKRRITK